MFPNDQTGGSVKVNPALGFGAPPNREGGAYNFLSSRVVPTSNEIRPVNKAVRYIKYTNSPTMPDMPEAPKYTKRFRYIVKVRN